MKRLRMAARKRKKLLDEIVRKERLQRPEILSLEHKMKHLEVSTDLEAGRGTKRKEEWFHVDSREKTQRLVDDVREMSVLPHCCMHLGSTGLGGAVGCLVRVTFLPMQYLQRCNGPDGRVAR